MSVARQVDFDHMVKECMDGGSSLEDAVQETVENYQELNYDVTSLFIYSNSILYDDKLKIDKSCSTVNDTVNGISTVVNLNFALQGLEMSLSKNPTVVHGCVKILESQGIFNKLFSILIQSLCNDDEDANDEKGEDDDSSEDEDEHKMLIKQNIIGFLLFFAQKAATIATDFNALITLTDENITLLYQVLDDSMSEARITTQIVEFITLIISVEDNRSRLLENGIVSLLDLAGKMNKKHQTLLSKIDALIASMT